MPARRQVLYIERHLAWPVVAPAGGGELRLNYSHEVRVLLREIGVILRMGLPVPVVASALLSRRQYLVDAANSGAGEEPPLGGSLGTGPGYMS